MGQSPKKMRCERGALRVGQRCGRPCRARPCASTRSEPSCWSAALRSNRVCVSYGPSSPRSSPNAPTYSVYMIEDLAADWRRLVSKAYPGSSKSWPVRISDAKRLMTVPGIGPIISSAMVAEIGSGAMFQRTRLRCLSRTGAQTDLDRRPHDPRQGLQTRQSLPARSVCPGGLGRIDQAAHVGALRAQAMDYSCEEATASQRAR